MNPPVIIVVPLYYSLTPPTIDVLPSPHLDQQYSHPASAQLTVTRPLEARNFRLFTGFAVNSDALPFKRQGSPSNSFLPGSGRGSREDVKNHLEKFQQYKIACKGGLDVRIRHPKENKKSDSHNVRVGKEKNSTSISNWLGKMFQYVSIECILVTLYHRIL